MFTPDFIGSDLTMYAPIGRRFAATVDMERIDPRLDLATTMAISGAAVSANMGANTVRLMSPTLALLNIRLGYWLRNPRYLAIQEQHAAIGALWPMNFVRDRFYLLLEMLNQLDETSRNIYLTDGGHIENLGAYELLKRGCQLIVVVDAEADPHMSFCSLLKLERYARIDLGVLITLPWERIAATTKSVKERLGQPDACLKGPHCAVGRIYYEDGTEGLMVYFKSSVTGDEKDYVLDYMKRYPAFPHEATGDQFFTEEQFEVYRVLGFHMVDRFFDGTDEFCFLTTGKGAFSNSQDARAAVMAMLSLTAVESNPNPPPLRRTRIRRAARATKEDASLLTEVVDG